MAKRSCLLVLAASLAGLLPAAAQAGTTLATNPAGDQVLLHRVLDQRTRPLYAGTRAPRGAFGPLAPVTAEGGPWFARAVVDDAGGMVAGMTAVDYTGVEPPRALVAARPPSGAFEPVEAFSSQSGTFEQVAANARGDAIVALRVPGQYRFRPSGGAFGPPTELPGAAPSGGGLAVDLDGTAAFIWSESAPPPEQVRTFESHRPPGGEFGTPVQIPGVPYGPYFAAASNGRALLVWTDGRSIWAAERPPGARVGAPFKVADSPEDIYDIEVAIAPSGAAAITFGFSRYYLTARDPGGSFDTPERLSGWPARVAVDDAGDAAVAWQSGRHAVSGAYRPAGGGLGTPLLLARARPFAPGGYDLPGVAIADDGRATAAWEESDGARVRTYIRAFDRSVRRRADLVDTVPSYVREGSAWECRPVEARIVKSSPRATVFFPLPEGGLYGCLLARGTRVRLSEVLDSTESTQHTGIALRGALVAHANDFAGHGSDYSEMRVTDLRDPVSGVNRAAPLEGVHNLAQLVASRLKANGAVAFVDLLGATRHVKVWDAHATRPRLVDSGPRIDAGSLRLRGSTVTWRNAGRLRRARLR